MQVSPRPLLALGTFLVATTLAAAPASAQILGLPRVSQRGTTTQIIGVSEIMVVYHRPAVKGRKVWGELVPYGHVWRAGANENTVLRFDGPVTIGDTQLAAGMYGLHMIPGESTWTVALNKDSSAWGSYSYKQDLDAVRVEVTPEKVEFREWLQYEIDPVSQSEAVVALRWADLRIPFKVQVDTPELALEKIRSAVQGRLAGKWQTYHDAAKFCANSGIYSQEALGWIDRALRDAPLFGNMVIRAKLLEGLERTDEAYSMMQEALSVGNGNEIAAHGNELLAEGKYDRAAQFLEVALEKSPRLWWAWANLGQAFDGLGVEEAALESFDKAIELAPTEEDKNFVRDLRSQMERKS